MQEPISKITRAKWTSGMAQAVEYLLCKCEALNSNPSSNKKNFFFLRLGEPVPLSKIHILDSTMNSENFLSARASKVRCKALRGRGKHYNLCWHFGERNPIRNSGYVCFIIHSGNYEGDIGGICSSLFTDKDTLQN
jgi:hypothetical protein